MAKKTNLTFIDLFAGIGGFHLAFHKLGLKCVFASEIDADARVSYEKNFRITSPKTLFKKNFKVGSQGIFIKVEK